MGEICQVVKLAALRVVTAILMKKYFYRQGNYYQSCEKDQQASSEKVQIANILVFAGSIVSASTTQFCLCSAKAVTETVEVNEYGCVQIKLYLYKPSTA